MQQQQQPESSARRRASSSSACSTAPRRTTIGCMAGLLRLFSPYHRSHHRKRLTAKNNPKQLQQPASPAPTNKKAELASSPSPVFLSPVKPKPTQQQQPAAVWRRRSCDAPRSPTIAPEHRRSSCDSPRPPPPAIVARLMGLEESSPPSPAASAQRPVVLPTRPPPPPPPPPAAEKQRKLLDALEKCDEDLKTLRRIIAAVHAAEMRAAAAAAPDVVVASVAAGNKAASAEWLPGRRDEQEQSPSPSPQQQQYNKDKPRGEEQYPSPDSVLDIVSSPRFSCRKRPSPSADHDAGSTAVPGTTKTVKPSPTFVFSGEYCKTKAGDELPQPQTAGPSAAVGPGGRRGGSGRQPRDGRERGRGVGTAASWRRCRGGVRMDRGRTGARRPAGHGVRRRGRAARAVRPQPRRRVQEETLVLSSDGRAGFRVVFPWFCSRVRCMCLSGRSISRGIHHSCWLRRGCQPPIASPVQSRGYPPPDNIMRLVTVVTVALKEGIPSA